MPRPMREDNARFPRQCDDICHRIAPHYIHSLYFAAQWIALAQDSTKLIINRLVIQVTCWSTTIKPSLPSFARGHSFEDIFRGLLCSSVPWRNFRPCSAYLKWTQYGLQKRKDLPFEYAIERMDIACTVYDDTNLSNASKSKLCNNCG